MSNFQNIITQSIGFIGLALAVLSFQSRRLKGILLFQTLANAAFIVHYVLLGAYTGAAINFLGAFRNIVFYNKEKSWASKKFWLYFFITVYIASGIASWENIYSLLPILGVIMTTMAYWVKDAAITRKLVLPGTIFWLVYSIAVFSIAGTITEILILVSVITSIVRYDIKKEPLPLPADLAEATPAVSDGIVNNTLAESGSAASVRIAAVTAAAPPLQVPVPVQASGSAKPEV
ncbi:MAG: YgjV family protein [Eubacteriales bacterium]|nr:YgjV family protein [Eubacteriales bacterium]